MNSELVVDVKPSEISIALLEDKRLVELTQETREEQFAVGNIYLGKVKKIMPGLNAAFVDVGYEKDAFIHYLDLGSNFNTLSQFTLQALSDPKKAHQCKKLKCFRKLKKQVLSMTCSNPSTNSGTGGQRTHLYQRTAVDSRSFISRTFFGVDSL